MSFPGHPYSDPLEIALRRELQQGESMLWKGRPLSRINPRGFAMYLFAIPWTAFSLFWVAMAIAGVVSMEVEGGGLLAWAFPLFGVPFVAIGLGMLAMPFLPLFNAAKTLYAVTDRRVIELRLGKKLNAKSVPTGNLGAIERVEGRDGTGSLKIAVGRSKDSDGDWQTDHFEMGEIEQVMEAETAIRRATGRFRAIAGAGLSS